MAYEVTKRIKGRDYRYLVETQLDPQTKRRKAKWTYVGPVVGDGVREVVAHRSKHVTEDDIVAAAAKLLEARDPEYVTVAVIAAAAGASRSTFYRYFENRERVLNAALVRLTDMAIREHPRLDSEVRTMEAARATFRAWCAAHYQSIGGLRAIRKMISEGYHGKVKIGLVRSLLKRDPWAELEAFFRAIDKAGVAQIPDPSALSQAVLGSMIAVKYVPYLTSRSETLNLPAFEHLYPMFERALFFRTIT
jgi:AcrR family transcriptional regulator